MRLWHGLYVGWLYCQHRAGGRMKPCELCGSEKPMQFCANHNTDKVETEQCERLLLTEAERDSLRAENARLREALQFLYDQVMTLEDYKTTRDVPVHEGEAVFDYAVNTARALLAKLGEG